MPKDAPDVVRTFGSKEAAEQIDEQARDLDRVRGGLAVEAEELLLLRREPKSGHERRFLPPAQRLCVRTGR